MHENRPQRDAALDMRNDDQGHDVEPARAGIECCLDNALVDAPIELKSEPP